MPVFLLDFVPSVEPISCFRVLRHVVRVVMESFISRAVEVEVPLGENIDVFDIPVNVKNCLGYNPLVELNSQMFLEVYLNNFQSAWQLLDH